MDNDKWEQSKMPIKNIDLLSLKFCVIRGSGTTCTPYYDVVDKDVKGTTPNEDIHLKLNPYTKILIY